MQTGRFGKARRSAARPWAVAAAFLLALAAVAPAAAEILEVQITLPVRARLDLSGRDSVALAPCVMADREGEGRLAGSDADVGSELDRYLAKLVRRETDLTQVEVGPLDYPTRDLGALAGDVDFWRALGERTRADLILACSLDFDVLEKSGYRAEEYVSPYSGEAHRRQVLVEETGFELDVVLQVYDGRSGELLLADNFKDFQEREGAGEDPVAGLFENLYAVEDRIAAIFSQGKVETERVLFAD